jgi:hypothetical protein
MNTISDEADDLDLMQLLPDEVLNHPDFGSSRNYQRWEEDLAAPALRAQGFEPSNWRTTDGDSFGPLVRAVDLTKNGITQTYFYG